jgi:hypothetical protein
MHAAAPDDSLFDEARTAIEEHFDFRRLYEIPEVLAPLGEDASKRPVPAGAAKR